MTINELCGTVKSDKDFEIRNVNGELLSHAEVLVDGEGKEYIRLSFGRQKEVLEAAQRGFNKATGMSK